MEDQTMTINGRKVLGLKATDKGTLLIEVAAGAEGRALGLGPQISADDLRKAELSALFWKRLGTMLLVLNGWTGFTAWSLAGFPMPW